MLFQKRQHSTSSSSEERSNTNSELITWWIVLGKPFVHLLGHHLRHEWGKSSWWRWRVWTRPCPRIDATLPWNGLRCNHSLPLEFGLIILLWPDLYFLPVDAVVWGEDKLVIGNTRLHCAPVLLVGCSQIGAHLVASAGLNLAYFPKNPYLAFSQGDHAIGVVVDFCDNHCACCSEARPTEASSQQGEVRGLCPLEVKREPSPCKPTNA